MAGLILAIGLGTDSVGIVRAAAQLLIGGWPPDVAARAGFGGYVLAQLLSALPPFMIGRSLRDTRIGRSPPAPIRFINRHIAIVGIPLALLPRLLPPPLPLPVPLLDLLAGTTAMRACQFVAGTAVGAAILGALVAGFGSDVLPKPNIHPLALFALLLAPLGIGQMVVRLARLRRPKRQADVDA